MPTRESSPHAVHWTLDPSVTFSNHGSFGACPRAVLAFQQALRLRIFVVTADMSFTGIGREEREP